MVLRDQSRDGFRNKLEYHFLSQYKPFWTFVHKFTATESLANKLIINSLLRKTPARPYPLSSSASYAHWNGLTDQSWYCRHLPGRSQTDLPEVNDVLALFAEPDEGPARSTRSSYLFPSFAQWFTDGFLLTDTSDRRRTFTSHQIDLNQVYGATQDQTRALRATPDDGQGRGELLTQLHGEEAFAPFLLCEDGTRDPRFKALPEPERFGYDTSSDGARTLFAFGGERANTSPNVAMVNTLFLREHNRLARKLAAKYSDWEDDRVFETARLINIVLLIKIVVEEYINHISPYHFQLVADGKVAAKADWNRPNWIPVEFNVLYRWHSLVPGAVTWGGQASPTQSLLFDNRPLLKHGMATSFEIISAQPAREMGLFNTVDFLLPVELATIQQARENQLASYNDYREVMSYPRVTRFEQISSDPKTVEGLRRVYRDVDQIELYPGLMAEDLRPRSAVPSLLGRMVAIDAFSHTLTNPVLAPNVFNAATLTAEGLAIIEATHTLQDLVLRNTPNPNRAARITMELDAVPSESLSQSA